MTVDTILVRDDEPVFVMLQDDVVLLSVQRGAYFSLNKVGSQIWNMLIRPRPVGEIFDAMAETHDIDRDIVTKDVINFLDALLERHLVRVVNPDMVP
jgi:hypothetical protein